MARGDPVLTATIPHDGMYHLRVTDADFGGSGNHFYRIAAGALPYMSSVFPLGVARGETTRVHVDGLNLAGATDVAITVPASAEPGSMRDVPLNLPPGISAENRRTVVVAEGPQSVETGTNDEPSQAVQLPVPGGVSGRIEREGDVDHYRFDARTGNRLIVEVFGRRLGTPIDSAIEILDMRGRPVPRAVLEPVAETEVAFRDHNSSGSGIRLTRWNNLAVNDLVLIGRELARIFALPRNPDDDCQFWSEQGQRVGFLETTPEHHPMNEPIYKVVVHPPGTSVGTGGVSPVTLDYRNDDGGPTFNKDSRLTFDPPTDGSYSVRVADVRGLGGDGFGYHLVVRAPRPDFQASISPENPNIPRGGTELVTVTVVRKDGFEGAIDVEAADLPPGITATAARVERGETTALLALTAANTAPAFSPPTWRLTARAEGDLRHEIDPGGKTGGWITVTHAANLEVTADRSSVQIMPGKQVEMKLSVDRHAPFAGRVPIDVRNLPQGVRVMNIGLNGVLVTEKQHERTITLYAEPWAPPMTRPFYAVGKAESAGADHSSQPITLVVAPAPNAR